MNLYQKLVASSFMALGLFVCVTATAAFADMTTVVVPGETIITQYPPPPQWVIAQLAEKEYSDRMNAQSYSSTDSSLGDYYTRKAIFIDSLLGRIYSGRLVSPSEIHWALNDDQAKQVAY